VAPIVGAIGSIAGMLIELAGILDDNFTIPVGAGIAMIAVNSVLPLSVV
jgi:dolichol kinase